ncbi:MATE family efflux transporter [Vibrio hannami]|uniref:MATE family efflux transporter n=1 Tax=Vibrio hannami TaxID=2717094 RepID=UPI00240EA0EA|nr:MATE family efflux transporter [Vibrio hannami]MDG3085419.1 MATE family efflux transporter [Vibrio hannami]
MTFQSQSKTTPPRLITRVAKLALPVAIQSALVAILALADVLMVSDFGKEATAAVGIASKWHFVAIMIMAGLSTANGILVSQYWGIKDASSAKTVTLQAIKLGIKIIVPVTLLITVLSPWIMQLQTGDATVIEYGSQYLWYGFPVLLLTHVIIVIESSMRSSSDAMTPLYLGAITIAINIGLNLWLIKGGVGIEAMGVAGAALATTLSRFIQVMMMLGYIYMKRHWLLSAHKLDDGKKLYRSFKTLAVPNACNSLLWAMGTLTYQMIFGHMGTTELAVYSMLGPFESLCYSVFFGVSVACSVLTGQTLGQERFEQAIAMSKVFIRLVFGIGIVLGAFLLLQREVLLEWLGLNAQEFYPMALPAISILCCGIWLRMLNLIIINGILRAGGETSFCLRMDFIAMWVTGIPLAFFAAHIAGWSFTTVYLLLIAEEIVKFTLCFTRYLKLTWVRNLTLSHN